MEKKLEKRVIAGEVRAIDDSPLGEGIIEGYLTKWNTVDSWRTSFKKGAFKNTFEKRGVKGTRLFWNHNELAGKILELREDDYGPFYVAKCNMDTEAGKKCYAHVRAEDVNCNSFGFNTVDDKWIGQVRQISEVDMLECGPVIFAANDGAEITNFRGLEIGEEGVEFDEARAIDFDETQAQRELNAKGWQLTSSLEWTLDDIYYQAGNPAPVEVITQVDTAIAKFHKAYIDWLNEYYDQWEERGGKHPCEYRNTLQTAINALDTDDLIKTTALTSDDVTAMGKGLLLPIEERSKLLVANPTIAKAHQETRSKLVESLCDELRHSGLTEGETERVEALLELNKKPSEIDAAIGVLREIRSNF